jgi:hypothetical protein
MGLQEIGCETMDRVHLAEDRNKGWTVVYTMMNLQMPVNFLSSRGAVSF